MIKWLYKRITRKLDLKVEQLQELKKKLKPESICKGPFVQGEKNCPNTTALAIKEGRERFRVAEEMKNLLSKYGVASVELWAFYTVFDIPSMMSERFFNKALSEMKSVVEELIREKQR